MKCLKKAILLTCGVLLLLTSYPQGVLIDCALNNYTEKYKVVDKKYKSENDYLIIELDKEERNCLENIIGSEE